MKIKILAKNIVLTEDLEQYIETKIKSIEKKLGPPELNEERICYFRIGTKSASQNKGNTFFAEATIKTSSKNYGALSKGRSIHEAIDELKDEISKKVRRYKGKKDTKMKKGGRMVKNLLRKIIK